MKTMNGKVISTKMAKTATVLVETKYHHPLYQKVLKARKKYHAHDEMGVKKGDRVKIQESRPLSKTKKWKIVKVIERPKTENKNPKIVTVQTPGRK